MNDTEINDKRSQNDFKGISFSKFQKSKVKNELINCLASSKVEPSCYWAAELICAGHFSDLWDVIITYISKHIHLGNPKLPIYIAMRIENFKTIMSNGFVGNELSLRNNEKCRMLFAEIIIVLCFSRKKHTFEAVKIKRIEEFDMTHMASKLKAPSIEFANEVFKKDDAKELFIAINEFSYHISPASKNPVNACYWLEWILEFDLLCKKKNEKCICERRTFAPVLSTYQMDVIWLVWDAILKQAEKNNVPLANKIIKSLLDIFSIKYTEGVKKRRRFIIYFAISLLLEKVDFTIEMIADKTKIDALVKKIKVVYKDVKKNEETPNTDYLFMGTNKTNLDNTIKRLEMMNAINGMA